MKHEILTIHAEIRHTILAVTKGGTGHRRDVSIMLGDAVIMRAHFIGAEYVDVQKEAIEWIDGRRKFLERNILSISVVR